MKKKNYLKHVKQKRSDTNESTRKKNRKLFARDQKTNSNGCVCVCVFCEKITTNTTLTSNCPFHFQNWSEIPNMARAHTLNNITNSPFALFCFQTLFPWLCHSNCYSLVTWDNRRKTFARVTKIIFFFFSF